MQRLGWVLCVALLACGAAAAEEERPIVVGLQADMSSGSAARVFRVSARDELVSELLVTQVLKRGHPRLGLLLEQLGPYQGLIRAYRKLATFTPEGTLVPSQP